MPKRLDASRFTDNPRALACGRKYVRQKISAQEMLSVARLWDDRGPAVGFHKLSPEQAAELREAADQILSDINEILKSRKNE